MKSIEIKVKGTIVRRVGLDGSYVIGRSHNKCLKAAANFLYPVSIVVLPEAPRTLSGFHCTLHQSNCIYKLVDGWGHITSRNGLFLNWKRLNVIHLQDKDTVFLGTADVTLTYQEADAEIEDPSTLQVIPQV